MITIKRRYTFALALALTACGARDELPVPAVGPDCQTPDPAAATCASLEPTVDCPMPVACGIPECVAHLEEEFTANLQARHEYVVVRCEITDAAGAGTAFCCRAVVP